MKNIFIIVLALTFGASALGQTREVSKTEAVSNNEEIYLNLKFAGDIKVEQWDKNEVSIDAVVHVDNGEGNEQYSLKTERNDGELKIYSDFGDYFTERNKYWEDKPKNYVSQTEINYIVKVPRNCNLRVKSISGSLQSTSFKGELKTELIAGDITLKEYDGRMRLKTVSGDVDVTMNKARVDASTVTGTIYSDLDIDMGNSSKNRGGNRIKGTVNNGEELIVLTTVSGNIYMRKG